MRLDSQILRRLLGVLLTLAVALTPSLSPLHTHAGSGRHAGDVRDAHAHHHGHARHDGDPQPEDRDPAHGDPAGCGLCHLLHQARADLSTPVPAVASLTLAGYRSLNPPHSPHRALTALSDAPPRGPPTL